MRMTRIYEVLTEYREAEQEGRIDKNQLDLIVEFIVEATEDMDRERFIENYNRWYAKTHGEESEKASGN